MRKICLLLGIVALLFSSCKNPEPIKLNGNAQGTYYSIIYYDDENRDFSAQIDSLLHAFDLSASLWEEASLLRRINSNQTDTLDAILLQLFQQAQFLNAETQGAFDCSIGKLVRAYGFAYEEQTNLSDRTIDSLLRYCNQPILFDTIEGTIHIRKQPETEFDFNAIAQGYSVDLIDQFFVEKGVKNYLIDVGGEVIARGEKPQGRKWSVGIERPAETKDSSPEVELAIGLKDQSVVTSGNYRKYYEKDGVRYSHTINPATGRPVEHSLLSASVVSSKSWIADGYATAFMVMGLEKSLKFIDDHKDNPEIQSAFFIYDDGGEIKTFATDQFEKLIQN